MANPNPAAAARPLVAPSPPDFVVHANRATVTINFVTNMVTLNRERRKWPLTNITKIIGGVNFVEIKTNETMPVEVIAGPPHFSIPPPEFVAGKKYVFLEGNTNGWKVRNHWRSTRRQPRQAGQGLPG